MQTPILDKYFHNWMDSAFGTNWRTTMPENEQTERQRAFFSGFASYYFFSMEAAALTDAQAERRLGAVNEEIKSYFAQMKRVPRDPKAN